ARWGETPSGVALGLLRHPFKALGAMFFGAGSDVQPTLDVQYYAHMLGPFLLLPLASPVTLLLALPTFATHFLSWRPAQHTIYYQYTALVTPFVVAAAVIGLRNLLSHRRGAAPPTGRLKADVSGPRIRPFADLGTSARLHELLERNRLGLVDAAGDNLIFLRDAPDSVSLWSQGERPVPAPHRVTFDGQLAYLGDELMAT